MRQKRCNADGKEGESSLFVDNVQETKMRIRRLFSVPKYCSWRIVKLQMLNTRGRVVFET